MSALAQQRHRARLREGACERPVSEGSLERTPALFGETGEEGTPSLGDVVSGAWTALSAHQVVTCLMCGGEMVPGYGAHAAPVGGRCRECGTTLS